MYDLPELSAATDSWWAGIARALRHEGIADVPERLTREHSTEALWRQPDLFLSQACGYNIVGTWQGRFAYVATPCYMVPGCDGPLYRSHIVVPAGAQAQTLEDLRGTRCAINGYSSHSGCNSLRATFAPLGQGGRFFRSVTVSGGHRLSLALLASAQVDVAAIDCVTYTLLARHHPSLVKDVRIIAQTVAVPVGPYVTRIGVSDDLISRLRGALARAMRDPDLAATRADLLIAGIQVLPLEDYQRIAQIETDATKLGYRDFAPVLAA